MNDLKSFLEEIDLYLSIPISMESTYFTLGVGDWNDMIIQELPKDSCLTMNRLIFTYYDKNIKRFGFIFHRRKKNYSLPEFFMLHVPKSSRPIGFKKIETKIEFTKQDDKNIYISSSGPMNIDIWLETNLSIKQYLKYTFLDYEKKGKLV